MAAEGVMGQAVAAKPAVVKPKRIAAFAGLGASLLTG
jgi:hypothetical protein